MRASAPSHCRSRTEPAPSARARVRCAALVCAVTGCEAATPQAHPTIGGRAIDPVVVEHVARRDGLSNEAARQKVIDTLRLVADAGATDDASLPLSAQRRDHLLRTARARLAIDEAFVSTHGPADIPDDHPRLVRARADKRFSHPELYATCQLIVAPPGEPQSPEVAAAVADPQWQARALAWMTEVREHVLATVPPGDPDSCTLLLERLELERTGDRPDMKIRGEGLGGFDLDACATEREADGRCATPQLAAEWVLPVREGPVPGLRGPFVTRFGVHLVLVREVLAPSGPQDPDFDTRVRAAVHTAWQTETFGAWVASLRTRHAALVASAPP